MYSLWQQKLLNWVHFHIAIWSSPMKMVRKYIVHMYNQVTNLCPHTVPSAAPQNVTATSLDSRTIELTWKPPPEDTHNGIIRQYSIDIFVSETRENVIKHVSQNSTSTLVMDLHPYYTYSFKVAAITVAAGPQSMEVILKTLEDSEFCQYIAVL